MTPAQLHPERLIEREHAGELSAADAQTLASHRRICLACAAEAKLHAGFRRELEPDATERARAASLVDMLLGGAPAERAPEREHPPRPAPRGHVGLAVGLSIAAHAAAVVLLMVLVPERAPPALEVTFVQLTPSIPVRLEPGTPPLPAEPAASPSLPEPVGAVSGRPRMGRARATVEAPSSGLGATVLPPESATIPVEPDEGTAGPTAEQLRVMLAPAAVARGGWTIEGAPSTVGPPAGIALPDHGTETEAALEARLAAGLRTDAMARRYLARAEPALRRRADGARVYEGHRFEAVIRPDGSVEFHDQPNVGTNGFASSGTFDITDAFMSAAGQDPHFAEREWFMRHTRALRERLEDEHRSRTMGRALRRLPARLERVWSTTRRSARARRARLFHIWDEMLEDDAGARARTVVVEFVRTRIPVDSAHAYTEAELSRLNARRESTERFEPY